MQKICCILIGQIFHLILISNTSPYGDRQFQNFTCIQFEILLTSQKLVLQKMSIQLQHLWYSKVYKHIWLTISQLLLNLWIFCKPNIANEHKTANWYCQNSPIVFHDLIRAEPSIPWSLQISLSDTEPSRKKIAAHANKLCIPQLFLSLFTG